MLSLLLIIYILILFVPFLVTYKMRKRMKGFSGFCLAVAVSSILMSSTVVVLWLGGEHYLSVRVAQLDRNGDGVFSDDESKTWTKEESEVMNQYYVDGGRNVFAVIIFPIFSVLYSILINFICWLVGWLVRIFFSEYKKTNNEL